MTITALVLDSLNTPPQQNTFARAQMMKYLRELAPHTRVAMFLLSQLTRIVPSAERGKQIYAQRSCGHCHGPNAQGTKTGPTLAGAKGTARTDAWILEHFRNPSAETPNSVMPRVWAAPWEMQSLLDYLKGLRA